MANDGKNKDTIFITLKQAVHDTGLPYKRLYNDIKSGKLHAVKRGKSYYIYTSDMGDYCYRLTCEARGLDPDAYKELMNEFYEGVNINDKPKN